jgi:hypothetical protein
MCYWKNYDDGWRITEKATITWTEKPILTCHLKGYDDGTSKMAEILCSESVCHQISSTFQWFILYSGSVCHQIIYTLQWLNMHLHSGWLQLPVAMMLYKDMPSWNASSHFTHTLSLHSRTTLFNMPRYLIPAWNERSFCRCGRRAKLTISLVPTTYGRRCWVCPHTDPSGCIGFYITIS